MFLSFEGIDGSGKSTQISLLAARLKECNLGVEVFREPGGTPLSERIRGLLLDSSYDITPFAELLLFSAARTQLVAQKIEPALKAGQIVICDRFFDSTTAYQGAGRQVEEVDWLVGFHLKVTGGLVPNRTYLLRLPIEAALARREQRENGGRGDRMEQADVAFYERVSFAYERMALLDPDRFLVLNAEESPESLHEQIWDDLERVRKSGGPEVRESGGPEVRESGSLGVRKSGSL